jgi:hypothetical protein
MLGVSKKITGDRVLAMPVIWIAGLHDRRDRQLDPPRHTVIGQDINPHGTFDQIQRIDAKCQTNKPFHPIVPVEKS